jgi:hypothetical protein
MLKDELIARTHPGARDERLIIETALGLMDSVQRKAAEVKSDRRLSQAGIQARLVEIAGGPWKSLGELQKQARTMVADIESARGRMVPKRLDPADFAGAVLQSEMRSKLCSSTRSERLRLARDRDEFAVAALTAPPELSGFGDEPVVEGQPSDIEIVRTAFQQRNFVELYAGIQVREQTMSAVTAALEIAARQICSEAGVEESEIDRLTSKEEETEVDPNNLPQITRADLNTWSATDPGRAAAEMRKVYEGRAKLVEAA